MIHLGEPGIVSDNRKLVHLGKLRIYIPKNVLRQKFLNGPFRYVQLGQGVAVVTIFA
ncbi:hypothetical protein HKBW3S47_02287, partial [Candidatus Hakubella thermalkaliphila]